MQKIFNALQQQLSERTKSEQIAIIIGVAFIFLYIVFIFVISPINESREKLRTINNQSIITLQEVQKLAKSYNETINNKKAPSTAPLNLLLTQSLEKFNLKQAQIKMGNINNASVKINDAPIDNILKLLHELEVIQGATILDASVKKANLDGLFNTTLTIKK